MIPISAGLHKVAGVAGAVGGGVGWLLTRTAAEPTMARVPVVAGPPLVASSGGDQKVMGWFSLFLPGSSDSGSTMVVKIWKCVAPSMRALSMMSRGSEAM